MKTYKTFKFAKKNNPSGFPIIRIGELYIVGVRPLDAVSVINEDGHVSGYITMKKLDRIGNGNRATPEKESSFRVYK